MIHFEAPPSPLLAPYVERYLFVECSPEESKEYPAKDKLLPDGTATIFFNLGSPHRCFDLGDNNRFNVLKLCWLTGIRTTPMIIGPTSGTKVVGVRFRPWGLAPFLCPPAVEFSGRVIELDEVWGRWGERVCDRLAQVSDSKSRFTLLEDALLERAGGSLVSDPRVRGAVQGMERDPCRSVSEISERMGLTRRHLTRLFNGEVGLSPKKLSRLRRFRRVTHAVAMKQNIDWTWVANDMGYYDQSHLIADFQEFAGLTPESYLKKRTPFEGFISV